IFYWPENQHLWSAAMPQPCKVAGMAVALRERRSLADLVHVRQSAVVNTFMTMFFIRKQGTPDEPSPDVNPVIAALPAELKERVSAFWDDAPHDFAEALVIALRAGVLFERDLDP